MTIAQRLERLLSADRRRDDAGDRLGRRWPQRGDADAAHSTTTRPTSPTTEALTAAFEAEAPGHHLRDRAAPGRRRGRQHRSRPGSRPARWPTSSTTTPARCSRRSTRPQTLVDLTDEPLAGQHHRRLQAGRDAPTARSTACRTRRRWAAASSTTSKIYEELGLSVPKTWDEFMANNEKIKAAGKVPVDPDLRRHLDLPALRARRLLQRAGRGPDLRRRLHRQQGEVRDDPGGDERLRASARRCSRPATSTRTSAPRPSTTASAWSRPAKAAHYPMLTFAIGGDRSRTIPTTSTTSASSPSPGDDAAKNGLTVWMPAGALHPEDERARRGGQGLPGLRRHGRGLRRHDRGASARPAPT